MLHNVKTFPTNTLCTSEISHDTHAKRLHLVRTTRKLLKLSPVDGLYFYLYKWKNLFYEMKGDVGMSLHEKERNKKMPTPRQKVTHNPIPTSLFCFNMSFVCLFVCYECIRQSKQHNILTSNFLHENVRCSLGRNKDVGMGL